MKFYTSTLHDAKVRTDAENNQAFIKYDGEKERKALVTNKVVNDAILEGKTISEDAYNK